MSQRPTRDQRKKTITRIFQEERDIKKAHISGKKLIYQERNYELLASNIPPNAKVDQIISNKYTLMGNTMSEFEDIVRKVMMDFVIFKRKYYIASDALSKDTSNKGTKRNLNHLIINDESQSLLQNTDHKRQRVENRQSNNGRCNMETANNNQLNTCGYEALGGEYEVSNGKEEQDNMNGDKKEEEEYQDMNDDASANDDKKEEEHEVIEVIEVSDDDLNHDTNEEDMRMSGDVSVYEEDEYEDMNEVAGEDEVHQNDENVSSPCVVSDYHDTHRTLSEILVDCGYSSIIDETTEYACGCLCHECGNVCTSQSGKCHECSKMCCRQCAVKCYCGLIYCKYGSGCVTQCTDCLNIACTAHKNGFDSCSVCKKPICSCVSPIYVFECCNAMCFVCPGHLSPIVIQCDCVK
eukprot:252738_1